MRGSIDRLEDDIAIVVWDNKTTENIKNTIGLKEGDRVVKYRGKIKKMDNTDKKQEMIALQQHIFRKDGIK